MCDCTFCASDVLHWHGEGTVVKLPLIIRICDETVGRAHWCWLIKYDSNGISFVFDNGRVQAETYTTIISATTRAFTAMKTKCPSLNEEQLEKMWHFKTQEGVRSLYSLRLASVRFDENASNRWLEERPMACHALLAPQLVEQPIFPAQNMRRRRKAVADVESSSSRKRPMSTASRVHSNPPPRSPSDKMMHKGTPYAIHTIGGNQLAQELAATYVKRPWDEDTVCEILCNDAGPPMILVGNEIIGRQKLVKCAFMMPDGTITQDMYMCVTLLAHKYRHQISHL